MNNRYSHLEQINIFVASLTVMLALISSAPVARSQNQTERDQALALYESNNFVGALPLLERVAAAHPADPIILSRLGFALYATSVTEKDPVTRRKLRERARNTLLKSQSLGDDSNLTRITLESLSGDDADAISFSKMKAADNAIREGEEAFVRGDMDKAIAAYKRALELDPKLYDAALYIGDVEFKKAHAATEQRARDEHFEQAGIWFAKAIAIDGNRETAYRYWGDALDAQGRSEEARDKFVDAIIAEPHSRRAYVGLTQWGTRHNVQLVHPKIEIPIAVAAKKPGEINISVSDEALKTGDNDGTAAWIVYGIIRSTWMDKKEGGRSEKFARAYPGESAYRHSLAEEADALRGVLESLQEQTREKRVKMMTPSLENLMKLTEPGMIEAYVLFVHPDEGIGRDYDNYRKLNRDKLKEYWLKLVVGAK